MEEKILQLEQRIADLELMLIKALQEMKWKGSNEEILNSLKSKAGIS